MILSHNTQVLGFAGETLPHKESLNSETRPLTYRDLVVMALNNVGPEEQLTPDEKARMYRLTLKFYEGDDITLSVEEAAFLKERAGNTLSPLAYGRLCDWIEGGSQKEERA